jgi:DNA-binding response OmpR family regulator
MNPNKQKFPETTGHYVERSRRQGWAIRQIRRYLRFIEAVRQWSHEVLMKHGLEERTAIREMQSEVDTPRRPLDEASSVYEKEKGSIVIKSNSILIIDDEQNIRLTLTRALENLGVEIDLAENGEEGLFKLKEKEFSLILLDLNMPGMGGMEMLRQVREIRPDIRVIIITAYGTVERAVEAMKLGAVDFVQKPFVPDEIRGMVKRVIDREKLDEQKVTDYLSLIELAKRSIMDRHFDAAAEHVRKAISLDPGRAEAFNLLGAIMEIRGDRDEALKNYGAALSLDPSYRPAVENLNRATSWRTRGVAVLPGNVDVKKKR